MLRNRDIQGTRDDLNLYGTRKENLSYIFKEISSFSDGDLEFSSLYSQGLACSRYSINLYWILIKNNKIKIPQNVIISEF